MFRMLAPWALTLGVLIGADRAGGADDVLAGKGLRADGTMYVLRSEDDVKKASDVAEARLKEYRRAANWEKMSTRDEASRKSMAAELTKQRAAMKKELDRTVPQINAQARSLSQQQNALRQQMNGLRYGTSGIAAMAYNQLVDQHNELTDQIDALHMQSNRMVDSYRAMGEQIDWLDPSPESAAAKTAAKPPTASADQKRQAYIEALAALRKVVDETKQGYEVLAEDDEVEAALKARNTRSTKLKYVLGPTKKFLNTVQTLEQAEAKSTTDAILDEPMPTATSKRKSRTARGR